MFKKRISSVVHDEFAARSETGCGRQLTKIFGLYPSRRPATKEIKTSIHKNNHEKQKHTAEHVACNLLKKEEIDDHGFALPACVSVWLNIVQLWFLPAMVLSDG